jgi:DNA-binding response OmpR family regulator
MFPHSLSYSVLVVEDNHDLNRLFTRQLAFSGHQVIGLESLEAAMLYLDTHPAPDLIIMDLELGDGSGYTCSVAKLKEIKPAQKKKRCSRRCRL